MSALNNQRCTLRILSEGDRQLARTQMLSFPPLPGILHPKALKPLERGGGARDGVLPLARFLVLKHTSCAYIMWDKMLLLIFEVPFRPKHCLQTLSSQRSCVHNIARKAHRPWGASVIRGKKVGVDM